MLQIKIDGVEHAIDADPQMPLLGAIRDIVGLTGTKIRLRGRRLRGLHRPYRRSGGSFLPDDLGQCARADEQILAHPQQN